MEDEFVRYFQYLEGERNGMVVESTDVIQEDDNVYIEFVGGDRCNQSMIAPLGANTIQNMFMAEVSSPTSIWKTTERWVGRQEEKYELNGAQERVCVQPFVEGRKVIDYIPPAPPSRFGRITKKISTPKPIEPIVPTKPEDKYKDDPVWVMLNKSKKFDTEVKLDLIIALPKKSLFNVIDESFDEGGKNMIKYIIETMDVDTIKESLKNALLIAYDAKESVDIVEEENDKLVDPTQYYSPEVIEESIIGDPKPGGSLEKNVYKDLDFSEPENK